MQNERYASHLGSKRTKNICVGVPAIKQYFAIKMQSTALFLFVSTTDS
jgi:hypothetical protein